MAEKDTPPAGRALQWSDLKTHQRKIVSDNMRDAGLGLSKTVSQGIERSRATAEDTTKAPARRALAKRAVASGEAIMPHIKDAPVTLQKAANTRQDLYNEGIEDRKRSNPGDPHQVIPTGAGWYFEHHRDIAASAKQHGVPKDRAIAASGVMSPMNSPENERAAVGAIMDAYANHSVKVTPEVHKHLAKSGIDVTEHLGKTVPIKSLPPGSLANLSSGNVKSHVETGADLTQVARGGPKGNITRAEHLLHGNVAPEDAVDPHSAPKVWSYIHNTQQAEPNSPTHVEFMGRVHHDALIRRGQISEDQQALDLYGHGEKTGGHLLSPQGHTVEDTWQNAATFNQPKELVGDKSRTSVYKAAGSLPETYPVAGIKTRVNPEGKRETAFNHGDIGNSAITHAFNNRATQKAAEQQSTPHNTVPPVAVQEVGWVQMRKTAGKDPAHNQAQVAKAKAAGPADTGQPTLPGLEGLVNDRRRK